MCKIVTDYNYAKLHYCFKILEVVNPGLNFDHVDVQTKRVEKDCRKYANRIKSRQVTAIIFKIKT